MHREIKKEILSLMNNIRMGFRIQQNIKLLNSMLNHNAIIDG